MTLLAFMACHWLAYRAMLRVCGCELFPISCVDSETVRIALSGLIVMLYLVAWIEVIRMLHVRWWPHWGTLASNVDLVEAARSAFPVRTRLLVVVAVAVCAVLLGCDTFVPGREPTPGWSVGVATGVGGAVGIQYAAWFIRVSEPFLPIPRPGDS
jgi:hypothetical protein